MDRLQAASVLVGMALIVTALALIDYRAGLIAGGIALLVAGWDQASS
jgi:hypothetical protein